HHRRGVSQASRGHGDVGRAPAQVLAEGAYVREGHPDLLRVEVDADAPHGDDTRGADRVRRHTPASFWTSAAAAAAPPPNCSSSWDSSASSRPPAIIETSSSSVIWSPVGR